MKRDFLMLAHTFKPGKDKVVGWFMSEKLDGNRCFWDGGISRGIYKSVVPWANNEKDERYVSRPVATGLWTRYGNVFQAPDSFLDSLPPIPLDGELYTDRKSWQTLNKAIKTITPDPEAWSKVKFHVFDIPEFASVFAQGESTTPNFKKVFDLQDCMTFLRSRRPGYSPRFKSLQQNYPEICRLASEYPGIVAVDQTFVQSFEHASDKLEEVISLGGEGVMFRDPKSYWEPKRSHSMVKWKPYADDEATVTGYTWGRQTDKGSKLLGKMGALVTSYRGQRLEMSGFTDLEREMTFTGDNPASSGEGFMFPGTEVSSNFSNERFPRGSVVTFKYRELTDSGIPKEASYMRKHLQI